jgi:glycosyltransferase involved in cell wall biosynthesis
MKQPLISIAIPTYGYNGRGVEFIEHNLNQILIQTFKDYEVVLSDHSTDDTIKNVFNKYKNAGMNIRYYLNEKGRGIISPNINNAMSKCTGKWIKVLFQDDFLLNANALTITASHIQYVIDGWAMTTFWHSNDGINLYRKFRPRYNDKIWDGSNTMGCPSGLIMRNKDIIYFDEGLNWLMDVDYYKKMHDKYGNPLIIEQPTYVNRTWGNRLCDTIEQGLKDKELNLMTIRHGEMITQ